MQISFIVDLPKDLQVMISGYCPNFILLCEYSNWHFLIRQNFGLEFDACVPVSELRALYIEKCARDKQIFFTENYTLLRSSDNKIFGCGHCSCISSLELNETFAEIKNFPENIQCPSVNTA